MTPAAFRKLALSMPGATESPHFERASFRIGTKIFATLKADGSEAMIPVKPLYRCYELIEAHPDQFFSFGTWTQKLGSLGIHLKAVDAKTVKPLLVEAHERIAPKKKKA
jgi:hypothetical protein